MRGLRLSDWLSAPLKFVFGSAEMVSDPLYVVTATAESLTVRGGVASDVVRGEVLMDVVAVS